MTIAAPAAHPAAIDRFDEILAQIAPGTAEREATRQHPEAEVRRLADAGFGRLRVPTSHGGLGVDLPTLAELLARAGRADSNIPQIWRGHFTATEILRLEVDPDVRDHWLRRIGDGEVFGNAQSEAAAPPGEQAAVGTRVRWAGSERLVSGRKFYSTGARFADHIRAAVADEDGNRSFVVVPARHPGVEHIDDWDGIGQQLTGSGTTVFSDVPVEPHGDIGRFQESMRGLDSFVQLVHLANLAGIVRSLVDDTVAVVRSRTRTSLHASTQVATEDPEVLAVVGTLHARRLTVDRLLVHAAEQLEAAHADGTEEAYARAYVETSSAQVAVIEAALDATTVAFHAGGSSAVRASVHLDRHWRNARTLASHNPVIYKPRVIGDYVVNGVTPVSGYYRDRASVETTEKGAES